MSNTILCVSDIHLKTKDQFDLKTGIISKRSVYKLKMLKSLVQRLHPDVLIIAGDDFDVKSPSEPLRTAYFNILDSLRIPVYLISGNHSQEHGYTAGTSEANLAEMIQVIQPREVFKLDTFTLIGYCRDKNEFLRLCNENPNKYLITHGDMPIEDLPFEHSFFGHVHKNYSVGNKHSIGALFTDSFGEENEKCTYLLINENTFWFESFPDRPIKTFAELVEFNDGDYLAVRYKLKGKSKDFLGLDQEAIRKSYTKTKVFFDIELLEEEMVIDQEVSMDEVIKEFIAEKSLTDTELKFGKLIMKEIENAA